MIELSVVSLIICANWAILGVIAMSSVDPIVDLPSGVIGCR
jgi:hypothetical protein